jgi:alkylation response protein AidB-like acyl-CoA dehydrogenase
VLSGAKSMVLHAHAADTLIIVARSAGAERDPDGLSLFLVPRDAPGVSLRDCPTVDGLRAADLVLDGVRVGSDALLGAPDGAFPALAAVIDFASVAVAAEAVGALEEANRITLEYLKTREQFGRKIGSFQALQHRMVEMFMEAELARSLVMAAAIELDEDAPRREATVAAAKLRVGRAIKLVGPNAIQLHGGMGMTVEYAIGHYFKRLTAIEIWFGNSAYQRRRYLASAP